MCDSEFNQITTVEQLRDLYPKPSALTQQKFLTKLDEHCEAMIALSPYVCLATCAEDGSLDISPRGDPPGSVKVLDESTLLIPDRKGNNRLDALTNLIRNPDIALLFMVPGIIETLRVSGQAQLIYNDARLESCAINGTPPVTGILVNIQRACLQCGKAVKRGAIFDDTYRVERSALPSFGKILADQTGTDMPVDELDATIDEAYKQRLY